MERKIWESADEEYQRKDSLYMATEIAKEYAKSSAKPLHVEKVLERVYLKLEELRKRKEA